VPGFDQGEQFRLTVTNVKSRRGDCSLAPLQVEDSFVLTAGIIVAPGSTCPKRSTDGTAPSFVSELATDCYARDSQLGVGCLLETNGCPSRMQLSVGPHIARGRRIVEEGEVLVDWFESSCYDGCREIYAVRIERLPPNTEMNGSR